MPKLLRKLSRKLSREKNRDNSRLGAPSSQSKDDTPPKCEPQKVLQTSEGTFLHALLSKLHKALGRCCASYAMVSHSCSGREIPGYL